MPNEPDRRVFIFSLYGLFVFVVRDGAVYEDRFIFNHHWFVVVLCYEIYKMWFRVKCHLECGQCLIYLTVPVLKLIDVLLY